jgi:hypothetical protein
VDELDAFACHGTSRFLKSPSHNPDANPPTGCDFAACQL